MPHLTIVPIYDTEAAVPVSAATSASAPPVAAQTAADSVLLALRVGRTDHDVFVGTLRRAGTTRALCTKAGLNPEHPAPPPTACGRVFIAGDGALFHYIVHWLRTPKLPSGFTALTTTSLTREAAHFGLEDLVTELKYYYPLREQVRNAKYALSNCDDQQMRLHPIPYVAANISLGNSFFRHGDVDRATKRWAKAYRCCLGTDPAYRSYLFVCDAVKTSKIDWHLEQAHRVYIEALVRRFADVGTAESLAEHWAAIDDADITNILALFPTFEMIIPDFAWQRPTPAFA